MLILLFLSTFLYAEVSMPEFECTSIKALAKEAHEILGKSNYPSITLRKYSNSDWLLNINGKHLRLEKDKVLKKENFILTSNQYTFLYEDRKMLVDLTGIPPSRQGKLRILGGAMVNPKDIAQLTCH